jgi:hypothetical protein
VLPGAAKRPLQGGARRKIAAPNSRKCELKRGGADGRKLMLDTKVAVEPQIALTRIHVRKNLFTPMLQCTATFLFHNKIRLDRCAGEENPLD